MFGAQYAAAYDALYADKDYASESVAISAIADDRLGGKHRTLLDLGCGTGSHIKELKSTVSEIVGVDISSHMLDIAKDKNPDVKFYDT